MKLHSSDVVETVTFETETWLKFRDETETSSKTLESETRDFKICYNLPIFFLKRSLSLLSWILFKFLAFFRRVLLVFLPENTTKNRWIIKILINHFFSIFKVSRPETFETETRPETFETETRPETFETETRKNGSRDESQDRDQVSRLHHPCTEEELYNLLWNERKCKHQDSYQCSNNTIILLVTQCKNDNTAFRRRSAVSGGLTLESDVAAVLNCETLIDNFACLNARNKFCDRLWAVEYVGGHHLVSADVNNCRFALFFMDIIACASEGYLW